MLQAWDARDRKPCAGKKRGVRLTGRQAQGRKGSVAGVAPTAVWWRRLLRYYGTVRMLSSGEGSGKSVISCRFPSDLDLPGEQPSTRSTLCPHPGSRPSVRFFGVRESLGGEGAEDRPCEPAAHEPRCGRGGCDMAVQTAVAGMAVAFSRMRRRSSCLPRNGSPQQFIGSRCRQSPSSLHQHHRHRAGALHYSSLRRGERHHTRLYHGWPARVATCARCSFARLPAQRCADLNTACPLSHTQRSSAKLAFLPITNHRRRP